VEMFERDVRSSLLCYANMFHGIVPGSDKNFMFRKWCSELSTKFPFSGRYDIQGSDTLPSDIKRSDGHPNLLACDTHHNDTPHNNTQHNGMLPFGLNCDVTMSTQSVVTLIVVTLSVVMLSIVKVCVTNAKCHVFNCYAQYLYAECCLC
jgi:hypothetical protein